MSSWQIQKTEIIFPKIAISEGSMLDEAAQFVFFEIIGNIFFKLGYFYLILLTFGKIKVIKKTRIARFFIAIFGMFMTFIIFCLISPWVQ